MIDYTLQERKVFQLWWLHDGRWYQEVASECGFDIANKLNKKNLYLIASRVARQEIKHFSISGASPTVEEIIEFFNRCANRMWPDEYVQFKYEIHDKNIFISNTTRNFALYALRLANTLCYYDCPCVEIRNGWLSVLNVRLSQSKLFPCFSNNQNLCSIRAEIIK